MVVSEWILVAVVAVMVSVSVLVADSGLPQCQAIECRIVERLFRLCDQSQQRGMDQPLEDQDAYCSTTSTHTRSSLNLVSAGFESNLF
jgi:hypothetical protein